MIEMAKSASPPSTSQSQSNRSVSDLASVVDSKFSRKRYWFYFIWVTGFVIIMTVTLVIVGQLIALGVQSGALGIDDTVTSLIAFLALMISISQYGSATNELETDEWIADQIKHNIKRITRDISDLTSQDKLILSALIKLKTRNEEVKIAEVVGHLSWNPDQWIAFLYELGDGSSLLKKQ
ncbi:MAG: hypothetical protein ACFFER_15960 [Candidatus Thorarchaeota archaeon]